MEEEVKTPEIEQDATPVQQTRADRIREASLAPDFSMPKIRRADDFFSESVMQLDNDTIDEIMRETGFSASTGEQVNTAVKNAYIGMNQLGDEMKIAYGNLSNYVTGGRIGDEIAETAYRSIAQRYNEMANREEAIGGITSDWAKLAGGATSFAQLALEGLATGGAVPLAHIGIQEFGQGTYNDMKAYADEHEGSLKGYKPEGFDLAANTANALLQVGIEAWLGVGSPRFLVGASRGLVKEGASGALQEFTQGVLSDLNEVAKGNQEVSIMLENAEDYLRDAVVGGFLQGSLGALTHHQNYARAVNTTAEAIAKAHGQEEPAAKDKQAAKAIIDAKERGYASVLTNEFKAAFDASTGEGKLQAKIAKEIKRAVEAKELDLDTADETEMAQRIEQIATQETLNAMDFAKEKGRAISEMELNNIVYKDNAIWLEGLTPEVGDKSVSYARVLAERQSGLAELQTRIDANTRELQQLKADLAEATAQNQESRAQVLQARIDKQNAIAEKNRLQAQKLEAQTAKLEKQIAKQAEQVKVAEPVKMAEVKTKPVAKRKSLKEIRKAKYNVKTELLSRATSVSRDLLEDTLKNSQYGDVILLKEGDNVATWRYVLGGWAVSNNTGMKAADAQTFNSDSFYEWIKKEPIAKFPQIEILYVKNEVAEPIFNTAIENGILFQGSVSGKGDTNRGGYDEQLKRIILGEKSDLSTIQHEFAHYWIQNNFKWARSGLASQDWLRRWRDVEEWLGIEPQDRLLSKSASEKFAKAYERYILEGKVAPELQWAFEGFQKAYQDIYEDLENEYFDLSEELAPEVVDWFNRNKEQSPKRLLQADEKKLEKALTLAAGGAVVEQTGDNTVVMTENNSKGEPVVTMGVKQSEVPQGDNLLVYSDKTTASKLQQSARKVFGNDVQVQQLATLDTEATLENFKNWIARDRVGAWDAMMNPNTSPIYQAYLYKAFSQEAMNDASLAVELANVNIAKSAREMGQALQALNINNESGFDMMEIIRNIEKSKGEISQEEINNSIAESGVFDVELSEEETNELENQTECKL